MEEFSDDLVALILSKIEGVNDRKSFSLVRKQWLRIEGLQRSSLQVFDPDLLPNFLPRFPNLLKFQASTAIGDSHIQLLAKTCPRIQVLNLNYMEIEGFSYEQLGIDDIDDEGLSDIVRACPDLENVLLRRRSRIGNIGVISLAEFSKKLKKLDLGWCWRVSDEALKPIGGLNLEVLNLQGCYLITDVGLSFLAEIPLCNTLMKLNIAECDQITDKGLISLQEMGSLEELNLAECGPNVTDFGCEMMLTLPLKKLKLSWLVNISDATAVVVARNCVDLEVLDMEGCDLISGTGICALSNHNSLKELVLSHSYCGITGDELEQLVVGCSTLERIVLDKRLRTWIPMSVQENVLRHNCVLVWR